MRVLAIRTPEGHYLEFTTVRAELEDGQSIPVDLTAAVFAELLEVPEPAATPPEPPAHTNGHREPSTITISGAGDIESQEDVRGIG